MGPKRPPQRGDHDLFRMELVNLIDRRHALVRLAEWIDWEAVEAHMGVEAFTSGTGRPALSPRLVASLLYLKHMSALSDEEVVARWVENPYWQHFSGERWFRHELPCDRSSLTRWRQRLGEEGCEWLLTLTIEAAQRAGAMKAASLGVIVVDTAVQPKAIAPPIDETPVGLFGAELAELEAGIAEPDRGELIPADQFFDELERLTPYDCR